MDRCASCGAGLAAAVTWCGQCFAAVGTPTMTPMVTATPVSPFGSVTTPAPFGGGPAAAVPSRAVPVQAPATPLRTTRWGKTPTTFGPVGRTVATLALLVPLPLMLVGGLADPFVWGGAGVWGFIVMPWALRDIWKAGQVPAG